VIEQGKLNSNSKSSHLTLDLMPSISFKNALEIHLLLKKEIQVSKKLKVLFQG
jgi:hypothetical protein